MGGRVVPSIAFFRLQVSTFRHVAEQLERILSVAANSVSSDGPRTFPEDSVQALRVQFDESTC
jgi:hypothetical protein